MVIGCSQSRAKVFHIREHKKSCAKPSQDLSQEENRRASNAWQSLLLFPKRKSQIKKIYQPPLLDKRVIRQYQAQEAPPLIYLT